MGSVEQPLTGPAYLFGPYKLIPDERVLLRDKEKILLTPKSFDLLLLLVEAAGHLKTREELIHALWPTTVVEEANLSWNVRAIRKALGDEGNAPQYIETVRGHGYRFIALLRTEGPVAAELAPARKRRHRLGAGVAASALLVVAAALIALFIWPRLLVVRRTATVIQGRPAVAVLGFQNLSDDREDDWIGTALTEMVGTDLSAGGELRSATAMDVARVRREFNLPAGGGMLNRQMLDAVHNNLGARYVASGAYLMLGSGNKAQLRVDVKLIDTSNGTTVAALSETGSRDELFALVDAIGVDLRDRLGVSALTPAEESEVRATIPASPAAARAYANGLRALTKGDPVTARKALEQAIALEPNFPLAYVRLSQAWLALGDEVNARIAARKALNYSTDLSRPQRLLIDGLYREAGHEWNQAVEDYQALFTFYPDDLQYGLLLARAQRNDGKLRDALATVATLRKLPPPAGSDPRLDLTEANVEDDMGNNHHAVMAAGRAAATARARGATLLQAKALSQLGQSENHVGNYKNALEHLIEARSLYEKVGSDSLDLGIAELWLGNVYTNQGKYTTAIQSFNVANATFTKVGNRYWQGTALKWIGNVHYYRNQFDQAQYYYELALPIFKDVHRDLAVGQVFNNLGAIRGEQGDQAGAIRYYKEAISTYGTIGAEAQSMFPLFDLGNTYAFIGKFRKARQSFKQVMTIVKNNNDKPLEAAVLAALADVNMQQDNLEAAHLGYEQALAIFKTMGRRMDMAQSKLNLAELALIAGDSSQAAGLAQSVINEYHREKDGSDEAYARAILGLALLAKGQRRDAKVQLNAIELLYPTLEKGDTRLYLDILIARLKAGLGEVTAAVKSLQYVIAQAESGTLLQYKARLALAQVQSSQGMISQGRDEVMQLEIDAHKAGFLLIAHQAKELLPGSKSTRHAVTKHGNWLVN